MIRLALFLFTALVLLSGCTRASDFVADAPMPAVQKAELGALEGRVADSRNGTGLTGVAIEVRSIALSPARSPVIEVSTSDAQGKFNFVNLAPGKYHAKFSRADLAAEVELEVAIIMGRRSYQLVVMSLKPGRLEGTVTNSVDGSPISGARVGFRGLAAYTDASGRYAFEDQPEGSFTAEFSAAGYISLFGQVARIVPGQTTILNVRLSPDLGALTGNVTNALNGQPLGGVSVIVRNGAGGPIAASTSTGSNGTYIIRGLPAGSYAVDFALNGFVPLNGLPTVIAIGQTAVLDVTMTPILAADQFRIVLNWARTKTGAVRDVDSYLSVPGASRTVNYSTRDNGDGANLDVDDTDWAGPETVTITNLRMGTYVYYVNNYNIRCDKAALYLSEVVVRLYKGSSLLKTYNIRPGQGINYEVLRIVDGNVVDIEQYNDTLPVEGSLGSCGPPQPDLSPEAKVLETFGF